jgi:hypothetical protein
MSGRTIGFFAATIAIGATAVTGAMGVGTGSIRVVISEKGSEMPFPPKGTFILSGKGGGDSGTTAVTPSEMPSRFRNGQRYAKVSGNDDLTGKKGGLLIAFEGVSVKAGPKVTVEYGTWHVEAGLGTGAYKSWKGGGRWAASTTGSRYSVQWEGLITG